LCENVLPLLPIPPAWSIFFFFFFEALVKYPPFLPFFRSASVTGEHGGDFGLDWGLSCLRPPSLAKVSDVFLVSLF